MNTYSLVRHFHTDNAKRDTHICDGKHISKFKFGEHMGKAIMHGTLSNLQTKIVGNHIAQYTTVQY